MIAESVIRATEKKKKIILEDGTSFVLYNSEVRRLGIREGAEIDDETISLIWHEILEKRAKLRCMNLLKSMDRTSEQLRQRLVRDGYPEDVVQTALSYVASYHYTDDLRYAANYIRQNIGQKSTRMIEYTLQQRGIDPETIQAAYEQEQEEEDLAFPGEDSRDAGSVEDRTPDRMAALRLMQKRRYDPDSADPNTRQKMYAYLMRKGFSLSDARWAENHILTVV